MIAVKKSPVCPLTNAQLRAAPVAVAISGEGISLGDVQIDLDGVATETTVAGLLTNAQLRAAPLEISGTVDASFPSSMAVTGDFYPAVQPVSGTVAVSGTVPVSIAAMPTTPVTGTFWPATQPVSGTVGVSGSVPVTGTFFPATQPVSIAATVAVSGPLTDSQLRASALSVMFTNSSLAVTGPLTDAQLRASAVPVSGAFFPATQPVSGPLTNAELRAAPVPVSGSLSAGSVESAALARGRANSFRTPGRAGTAGQKLFALHNGSSRIVHLNQITVDLYQTVVKAITVAPPVIRAHRITAAPTNGTALAKTAKDSALSSHASVTAWGDASVDGTSSASALTATIPAGNMLTQEFAPRFITAVGYEPFDRAEFLEGKDIVLRQGEGIVIELSYSAATQNPVTDMWIVGCDWWEA